MSESLDSITCSMWMKRDQNPKVFREGQTQGRGFWPFRLSQHGTGFGIGNLKENGPFVSILMQPRATSAPLTVTPLHAPICGSHYASLREQLFSFSICNLWPPLHCKRDKGPGGGKIANLDSVVAGWIDKRRTPGSIWVSGHQHDWSKYVPRDIWVIPTLPVI